MLAMTGDLIRKNIGNPGQEGISERDYPEKQPKSRTERHSERSYPEKHRKSRIGTGITLLLRGRLPR